MSSCFKTLVIIFFLTTWPQTAALGQDKPDPHLSPIKQIGQELFENTLLDRGYFQSMLRDIAPDAKQIEELIQKSIWMHLELRSETSMLKNSVAVGEFVSFELRDKEFYIRAMSTKQWGEVEQKTMQDLPSDLKSKRPFKVTKVTTEFITIKNGDTQLSIPARRIVYFQRGTEAFFK